MFRKLLLVLSVCLACTLAEAQIVNRMRVDKNVFLRYAYGRMQQFNTANLALADSIYTVGAQKDDYRYKCLALSLEMPVRYYLGEYSRMDSTVVEVKELIGGRKDLREFYFPFLHEYCEYLVRLDRAPEAMLLAREMERLAAAERQPLGRMYAYRIVGLIHSARDNHYLAIQNLEKAARFSRDAHAAQNLPVLYLLMAQECVKMKDFAKAEEYIGKAEEFKDYYPSINLGAKVTRACLFYAAGRMDDFREMYSNLLQDPLYSMQADADSRFGLDISYLRSRGMLEEALAVADSLGTLRGRLEQKQSIYADMRAYDLAYGQLVLLTANKDSTYIKVQNEDLAILDAEMNNAQLREEAQKLKARNQFLILMGFLVMFAIAFAAILVSQWKLRENLDEMRRKNNQILANRRAFQKAMEAKESENEYKIKILQNRKTNMLRL